MSANESPVMAVGEALAEVDIAATRLDGNGDFNYASDLRAARATFAAMAAEVEALRERVKLYGFMQNTGAADELRARAEAAEARAEGLAKLLREAGDTVTASTVEIGITEGRREYRRELSQRIARALTGDNA